MKTCIKLALGILSGLQLACSGPKVKPSPEKIFPLPADTSMIVYDTAGNQYRYTQYSNLIMTGKYTFERFKGKKVITPFSEQNIRYLKIDSTILNKLLLRWMAMADKIIIEKGKRKLSLERNGKTFFEMPIQLGRNPVGSKQKEGDGRTPEGLYNIDYFVNKDAAYYRGFHISYPNEKDKAIAKRLGVNPGGDIMIHGTGKTKGSLKDWTNGCIAVSDAHIDTLSKYTSSGILVDIKK